MVVIWERIWARADSQAVGVVVTRARRAVVLAERGGLVGGWKVEVEVEVEVEGAGAAMNVEFVEVEVGGTDAGVLGSAGEGAEGS